MANDDAFMGEIRMFGAPSMIPAGWLPCNGQLMSITQNTTLFSLLSNVFGGDGVKSFALPNFGGQVPMGTGQSPNSGNSYALGDTGGATTAAIGFAEMPAHTHTISTAGSRFTGDTQNPDTTTALAKSGSSTCTPYLPVGATIVAAPMAPMALLSAGSTSPAPHNNMAPTLTLNLCICVDGIVPQRS